LVDSGSDVDLVGWCSDLEWVGCAFGCWCDASVREDEFLCEAVGDSGRNAPGGDSMLEFVVVGANDIPSLCGCVGGALLWWWG